MVNTTWFRSWFNQCGQTSLAYRFAMGLMFFLHIVVGFAGIRLMLGGEYSNMPAAMFRLLIEAVMMLITCHFFLRPFTRLHLLNSRITMRSVTLTAMYIAPIAVMYTLLSYGLGKADIFSDFEITGVQFESSDGSLSAKYFTLMALVLGTGQIYFTFIFWVVLYITWHVYRKRNELEGELHLARLQQLANQINPHFLFNTLNSVRALVFSDQEKAAETITKLSELMRVHMHAEVEALSSIEQEWALANNYLDIERLRLQERLRVVVDFDDSLSSKYLPSLMLLTLLENSVKYGIAPSRKGGVIEVKTETINSSAWRLTVRNTLPEKFAGQGNGIGLKNIKKRLQLLYGDNSVFLVKQDEDYFTVSLEVSND